MNTDQIKPMDEDQLGYVQKEIKKTYLCLISQSAYDPEVVEVMKLAALANVQRRYEAGESRGWDQAAFNFLNFFEFASNNLLTCTCRPQIEYLTSSSRFKTRDINCKFHLSIALIISLRTLGRSND